MGRLLNLNAQALRKAYLFIFGLPVLALLTPYGQVPAIFVAVIIDAIFFHAKPAEGFQSLAEFAVGLAVVYIVLVIFITAILSMGRQTIPRKWAYRE